mmetsp:Transcript_92395/g.206541  ORF Transcript_92395/g.206541 Transcript_92395/m.206541 type:complete len:240 (-) Transcript_92395:890-1609(-)
MYNHVVHCHLRYVRGINQVRQMLEVCGLGHFHIEAVQGSNCRVMRGAPITDNVTPEAEILAQQRLQELLVLASMLAVDAVVGAHHGASARLERGLERLHVDLVLRTVADFNIHLLAIGLLIVVEPMLGSRDDAALLHLVHVGLRELTAEERVFARKRLEGSATQLRTDDLHIRAKQDVTTLVLELFRDRRAIALRGLRVEAAGDSDEIRELRGLAPDDLLVAIVALRTIVHGQPHGALF